MPQRQTPLALEGGADHLSPPFTLLLPKGFPIVLSIISRPHTSTGRRIVIGEFPEGSGWKFSLKIGGKVHVLTKHQYTLHNY